MLIAIGRLRGVMGRGIFTDLEIIGRTLRRALRTQQAPTNERRILRRRTAIPTQRHPRPLSLQQDTQDDRPKQRPGQGGGIRRVGLNFLLYKMISNWALIMLYIM